MYEVNACFYFMYVCHLLKLHTMTLSYTAGTSLLVVATLTVRDVMGSSPVLQGLSELFAVHKVVPFLNTEGAQAFINAKNIRQ